MLNLDKLIREINPKQDSYKVKKGNYVSRCSQIRPYKKYDVKIPKIIFQTCWSHEIPNKWKISPKSIKALMSGWKYVLMDDNENREFVKKHFPDFLPYYDAFPYNIQRADAIRYCWLYVHGGIYMDLDFEVQHPLDSLFTSDTDVYLVHSGNIGSYVTNSFMASKPGAKFWLEVIEEMKKPLNWFYLGKHTTVMNSTGPIMLSHVAKNSETVYVNLPRTLIMPCSICNIECADCSSYLKPLKGSSWTGWDTTFLNFWLCNWKYVVSFLICMLILILVFYILQWVGLCKDKLWPPWKYLHK